MTNSMQRCLVVALLAGAGTAAGQEASAHSVQAATEPTAAGGTIRGVVKAGTVPLPGVAVTATNTLTGKKYATTTDANGTYAMVIPRTGRYVVRAEFAAFASLTREVRITSEDKEQVAEFGMELASRMAAQEAAATTATTRALATAIGRGTQSLSVLGGGGEGEQADATAAGTGGAGASLPLLGGLGDVAGADPVAVSGQAGQMNGLAGINEDDLRQRIEDMQARARAQGGAAADQMDAVVGMLGGLMGAGGPGGGRGGRGGGGGRRGGGGGFRGFDPTTSHGAIFYQGGFPALQAQQSSVPSLLALENGGLPQMQQPFLSSQQNRFGVSLTGSPGIPRLVKASTKQFVFLNVTGVRNITPQNFTATVPTLAERGQVLVNGVLTPTSADLSGVPGILPIYSPKTGLLYANNIIPVTEITDQARAILNYYPLPNINGATVQNYQEVTTSGTSSTNGSLRFVRNFGAGGFGPFGGGGGRRQGANVPKTLRQNFNANFSFSRSATDVRNFVPLLGGKTQTNGYGLSVGYTVGYGRVTNNATLNWNRSNVETMNYFTRQPLNPTAAAGIAVPSQNAQLAQQGFYNGLPRIGLTTFSSISEVVPVSRINQTISFSDFVSYGHKKHNYRVGVDLRRVHADQLGGNNPLGAFTFSGFATESATSKTNPSNSLPTTGSALADLLTGQPQQTTIQAGLFKTYLRANISDAYAQDDFRVARGLTLNYGLRYEYFSPYVEKYNRLSNLDHNADFTSVDAVQPGEMGTFGGRYPRSLVNPDRNMFSPRFSIAWRPAFLKETVIRAGYGINFNTGQFATFAQSLAFQPPFAVTQNNVLATSTNATGCTLANMTLANGFGCSTKSITNTYAVNKNYRLGHVQVYNVDIQKSLPHGVVVNVGYNGSKGGNLDVVTAPNNNGSTVTTRNAQAFTFEDSAASSRLQQLAVSARKRLERGISLQVLYQYGHAIDNASSIGGVGVNGASTVQNSQRLDLEESNSSFDVRHKVTGNYVIELPFGPNRAFLSKGGVASKIMDGFSISGDFTFATGSYFTPEYVGSAAEIAAGGTATFRPDRVFSEPISGGAKNIRQWFNPAAFTAPSGVFGTASRNSIEGPGVVVADLTLSRTVQLGGTRSIEGRFTGNNAFNTVRYTGIDTSLTSSSFGQVTNTGSARTVTFLARYRF